MKTDVNQRPNPYHPGRPDYTGPSSGWAGYVYHNKQIVYCRSFAERVRVIETTKPASEHAVRLACLTYLGPAPPALEQAEQALEQAYGQVLKQAHGQVLKQALKQAGQVLDQAERAELTPEVLTALLALLAERTPEAPWDGRQLQFPKDVECAR